MKKLFLLIFAVLLVLGSALPLAAYRVTRAVLGHTAPLPAASSVPELPTSQPKDLPSADAETFPVEDQSAGKVVQLSRREYVLGAVAAEMPVSWPDEALKAQAVAAHPTRSTAGIMPPCKAVHGSPLILPGVRAV